MLAKKKTLLLIGPIRELWGKWIIVSSTPGTPDSQIRPRHPPTSYEAFPASIYPVSCLKRCLFNIRTGRTYAANVMCLLVKWSILLLFFDKYQFCSGIFSFSLIDYNRYTIYLIWKLSKCMKGFLNKSWSKCHFFHSLQRKSVSKLPLPCPILQ